MDRAPLMPKATAVWLVDNTSLTFEQIAEFCGLHVLEVKGIADGDVAHGIKGMDPISSGQLSREEIATAELNSQHRLKLSEPKVEVPEVKTKRGPLRLAIGTRTLGSARPRRRSGSASALSMSSRVSWPVRIGSSPLIDWAASPSAIAWTSSGCSLQKSAIWANDSAVLSTSQTAVALGIKGARSMGFS